MVGPDGCPGFKGPFPQPVSMSNTSLGCFSPGRQATGFNLDAEFIRFISNLSAPWAAAQTGLANVGAV
jgi:hypothetical protein